MQKIVKVANLRGSVDDSMESVQCISVLHAVELEMSESVKGAWHVGGLAISTILAKEHISLLAKTSRDDLVSVTRASMMRLNQGFMRFETFTTFCNSASKGVYEGKGASRDVEKRNSFHISALG